MDIYLTSLLIQLLILLIIILFALLSLKKPRLAALIFPVILPFYLVKLFIRPASLFSSDFLNSLFTPEYRQAPVIRPNFGTPGEFVIPTNLLEVLIIIFLVVNAPLILHGVKSLWNKNSSSKPTEPCHPEPVSGSSSYLICRFRNKFGMTISRWLLVSIIFLLLSTLASAFLGINARVALGVAKSWFFLPVLLFFALLPFLRSAKFRLRLLTSLALGGVLIALINLPFAFGGAYTYDGRLAGIFLSPNHLAMALVPGILALVIIALNHESRIMNHEGFLAFLSSSGKLRFIGALTRGSRRRPRESVGKIFVVLSLAIELITLYLTYSYGTWIALFAAMSFLIYKKYTSPVSPPQMRRGKEGEVDAEGTNVTKKSLPYYLPVRQAGLITVLLLLLLFATQYNNPKLQHIINSDYYSSLHSRIMIWNSALAISRDHWLFGIGGGNFQQAYLDYAQKFPEPYIEWAAPMPHNIFLAFLVQLGIVGLVSFCALLVLTFGRIWNLESGILNLDSKFKFQDSMYLWSLAYLIYLIIHGLIDTPYWKNDLAILFWLALAAIWSVKTSSKYNV